MKNVLYSASVAAMVLLLTALASGCSNDMNADQYTFACDEQTPCAEGFFCGPNGVCVENGTDVSEPTDTRDARDTGTEEDTQEDVDASDTSDSTDPEDTDTTEADTCTPMTWYRDQDGDSFGNPDESQEACERPSSSWVENDLDCDDGDARANPDQESYFEEPTNGGGFDFDCNGRSDAESNAVATCEAQDLGLCNLAGQRSCRLAGDSGWAEVPDCGEPGTWVDECERGCFEGCSQARTGSPRTQACR